MKLFDYVKDTLEPVGCMSAGSAFWTFTLGLALNGMYNRDSFKGMLENSAKAALRSGLTTATQAIISDVASRAVFMKTGNGSIMSLMRAARSEPLVTAWFALQYAGIFGTVAVNTVASLGRQNI